MSGGVLAEESYRVTPEAIVRYAGASGDFTDIHYDESRLREAGYDTFFAMGMLVAGRLGALVARTFGDDAVRQFHVRFVTPSWVDRTVTCSLRTHAVDTTHGTVTVDLLARDDVGVVVATGQAVVVQRG